MRHFREWDWDAICRSIGWLIGLVFVLACCFSPYEGRAVLAVFALLGYFSLIDLVEKSIRSNRRGFTVGKTPSSSPVEGIPEISAPEGSSNTVETGEPAKPHYVFTEEKAQVARDYFKNRRGQN